MNNQLLISRKGSAPKANIFACIAMLALAGLLLAFEFDGSPGSGEDFLAILSPILTAVAGLLFGFIAMRFSNAYINVYADRIEGYGMLSKGDMRGQTFSLKRSECTVSVEGNNYICVRGNNSTFYMYFTPEEVRQIYDSIQNGTQYGSQNMGQPPMNNGYQAPNNQPAQQQFQQPNAQTKPNAQAQPKTPPKSQPTTPPTQNNNGYAHFEQVPPEPEALIFACAVCGTQCRVPSGHGVVMITCPKCGNKFRAQTGQ